MLWNCKTDIDHWWHNDDRGTVPGNVVPLFGAGISVDLPTGLPPGEVLVEKLVRHLMHADAADELLSILQKHAPVIGRRVPRLEHLISVSANAAPGTLQLLNIFDGIEPNRNHHILAQHLLGKHGWAVTTNFDDGVEKASGYRIPVHLFDVASQSIRVLYGDPGSDWGLIKLHGTISEDVHRLGATLDQLVPGLPLPMRVLLERVFTDADVVAVAGYSASDHFDVNAFLRGKINRRFNARLVWINHQDAVPDIPKPPSSRGYKTFQLAFSANKLRSGPTAILLADLLGNETSTMPASDATSPCWTDRLSQLFTPSNPERHRIGAVLATDIGLVPLARDSIGLLRHETEDDSEAQNLEVDLCSLDGHWGIARAILAEAQSERDAASVRRRISTWRKAGRPTRALWELIWVRATGTPDTYSLRLEAAATLLDLLRAAQRLALFRSKASRLLWGWWIRHHLNRAQVQIAKVSDLLAEDEWQLLAVRHNVYCHDFGEHDFEGPGWLRELIEREISYPQLLLDTTYAIPGYYLNATTTYAELDRLDDMLDIRLTYVDMLVSMVRRKFFNTFIETCFTMKSWLAERGWLFNNHQLRDEYCHKIKWPTQLFVRYIKQELDEASKIAEALDSDHARSRVAHVRIWADRLLDGFSSWRSPRMYFPIRKSRRQALEKLQDVSSEPRIEP